MKKNIGKVERIVRIVAGIGVLALAFVGPRTPWAYLGIVPLATGLIGWCRPIKFSASQPARSASKRHLTGYPAPCRGIHPSVSLFSTVPCRDGVSFSFVRGAALHRRRFLSVAKKFRLDRPYIQVYFTHAF